MLLLSVIIISASVSLAALTQEGKVNIVIKNDPPRVLSVALRPEPVYEDSWAECVAVVDDEFPEAARTETQWYVDGKFVGSGSPLPEGFLSGAKTVTCEVMPFDNIQSGLAMNHSVEIAQMPAQTKVVKTALGTLGNKVTAREINEYLSEGNSVTGFVVNEMSEKPDFRNLFYLIVILALLVAGNGYVLIHRARKKRSRPKYPIAGFGLS